MARPYPRFVYSNPQNTKSHGPFIVHLLEPRLVFKVDTITNKFSTQISYRLLPLDNPTTKIEFDQQQKVWGQAEIWLQKQINNREIVIPEKGVELTFQIPPKNDYKG